MPLGRPVAKESGSTDRRYLGIPGWFGSGDAGLAATAVSLRLRTGGQSRR